MTKTTLYTITLLLLSIFGALTGSTLIILFPNHFTLILTIEVALTIYFIRLQIRQNRKRYKEIYTQNNKLIEELFIQHRGNK